MMAQAETREHTPRHRADPSWVDPHGPHDANQGDFAMAARKSSNV
jgi:hypothetical protein